MIWMTLSIGTSLECRKKQVMWLVKLCSSMECQFRPFRLPPQQTSRLCIALLCFKAPSTLMRPCWVLHMRRATLQPMKTLPSSIHRSSTMAGTKEHFSYECFAANIFVCLSKESVTWLLTNITFFLIVVIFLILVIVCSTKKRKNPDLKQFLGQMNLQQCTGSD